MVGLVPDSQFLKITLYKYSFHKKLGLRLPTIYSLCISNKSLHISKADTKISIDGSGGLHTISWLKNSLKAVKSMVIYSFVPCNAFCYLAIPYTILQSFTTAHDIYVNSAYDLYAIAYDRTRHLCLLALVAYVRIAYDGARH